MHMDRAIFELNAGVEATSLYILLCALLDQGESLTLNRARAQWNGDEKELFEAAAELVRRGVLSTAEPLAADNILIINPRDKWT